MPRIAKVAISLPEEMLRAVEKERKAMGESRSEFFRLRHLVHTFRGLFKIWWSLIVSRRLPLWLSIAAKKY